jgi:hypothetical protein
MTSYQTRNANEKKTELSFSTRYAAGGSWATLCIPGLRCQESNRFDETRSN